MKLRRRPPSGTYVACHMKSRYRSWLHTAGPVRVTTFQRKQLSTKVHAHQQTTREAVWSKNRRLHQYIFTLDASLVMKSSCGHPSRVIKAIPLSLSVGVCVWNNRVGVPTWDHMELPSNTPHFPPLTINPGSTKNNSIFTLFFLHKCRARWMSLYVYVCVHCVPYKKGLPFYSNFVCTFLEKIKYRENKAKKLAD